MARFVLLFIMICMNTYAKELKIINWNTYLLPKYAKNTSQDARASLIADYLLNSEEDFDIITLQEVFTRKGYEIITSKLKEKYPYHSGRPRRKWYRPVNSGVLILSKYPIRQSNFYMYSGMKHADRFSSKGVMSVTLEVEEGIYVQVASTHLQAQEGKKYESVRKSQYEYIKKEILDGLQMESIPLVLTGDFNINMYKEDEFSPFVEFMNLNRPEIDGDQINTVDSKINELVETTKEHPIIQEVLDYIFLTNGNHNAQILSTYVLNPRGTYYLKRKGTKERALSDHLPVVSIINI